MEATDMNGQPIEGTGLTEQEKQAILDEAAQEGAFRPKGYGKTTRPKNLLRKRKSRQKMSAASRARNKPKKLSQRKKGKPLHKRRKNR